MNQMYTFIKPNLQENLKITCDLFRSGVVEEYDEKTALLDDILELKEEEEKVKETEKEKKSADDKKGKDVRKRALENLSKGK